MGERRHFQSQYLYQITVDFFLQLCCTLSALHTPELQVFKEKWSHISDSPQEKPDIKAGITQYKCITFFFFNCLHFFAHIFQKIASEWVFYIITAELCRIKLLILSLPMGQSALMNKSGILFNITLKRHKGINNNLYQIKCSKKCWEKKKKRQLVLKDLVPRRTIIVHLHSTIFLNCDVCYRMRLLAAQKQLAA